MYTKFYTKKISQKLFKIRTKNYIEINECNSKKV